ncbi:hypothetical protein [Falsiroseomonas sp.]|uniref:hypothetical protein n=1 Tax=Falsiroseomonas sp. TaxID=2870721 RepID=UPI0035698869
MTGARRAILWLFLAVLPLAALSVLGASSLTGALDSLLELRRLAQEEMLGPPLIYAVLLLQAALIAIPFVPGAEVGFLLLALCRAQLAGHVYAATVVGLLLAFAIGRSFPPRSVERLLARLRLDRAAATVACLAQQSAAPPPGTSPLRRLAVRLLRHRCLCLVLLINTPGNTLLGGGGGIAMAAGLGGLFSFRQFLASVLIAVAPVPAFVLLLAAWS